MSDPSPFDHGEIDALIHGRLRLGVMAYLSTASPALFTELRDKVNATDGNLSTHLRKLEDAGYIRIDKAFSGRRPQTTVTLTETGRAAWLAWIAQINTLMNGADGA